MSRADKWWAEGAQWEPREKAHGAKYTYDELEVWGDVAARHSPVSRFIREVSLKGRWDRVFIGIGKEEHRGEVTEWLVDQMPRDAFRVRRVGIPEVRMGSPAWD